MTQKMTIMGQLDEIRESVVTNKVVARAITIMVSIMTACMITGIMFLWQLKEDVPLLKQNYRESQAAIQTLQNSVNNIRLDQQTTKESLIRVEEQVKIIKEKIDNK